MLVFDMSGWLATAGTLEGRARQMPWVLAVALTNAMKVARDAERQTMQTVFDRPTRYTLNSMQVIPATKQRLVAELTFKAGERPASKYLTPEVMGGARHLKAFERLLRSKGVMKAGEQAVPGRGVRLDAQGNIGRATLLSILAALGITTKAKPRKRRGGAPAKVRTDIVALRGKGASPGIYQRKGRTLVPLIRFVHPATYRARFPFYDVGQQVVPRAFADEFRKAWARYG